MKLKKCPKCNTYTLKETCKKCSAKQKEKTSSAHYKFIKVRDAPKTR